MKLDLSLLKRLLVIDHPSKKEWPMISFIINECYKIGDLEFEMDSYANIFIKKNTTNPDYYVCVVAHMDCVKPHANKEVKIKNGKIFGRNPVNGKQIGLGMDDANGICVALQLLKVIPDLKVCFTTEEECGFLGADSAAENIDFFCDVSYFVQADRHGKSDLITYTNCIYATSELWLQEITPLMAKYHYVEEYGIGTDIGVLAETLQLSAVNVSCGYYNEHTDSEYTVISELENCLNFIKEIIDTVPLDKQYEITIDYKAYNRYYGGYDQYGCYRDYNYYEPVYADYDKIKDNSDDHPQEWDDDLPCTKCKDFDCMHCPHGDWWKND